MQLTSKRLTAGIGIAALVLLLITARLLLPGLMKSYVESELVALPEYSGQVGDVDLNLLAGSYTIHNIVIEKTSGEVPLPFFSTSSMKFSIFWSRLIRGDLVVVLELVRPNINFVDSENEQDRQFGESVDWLMAVDRLVALNVDAVSVREGWVSFRNFDSQPPIDVQIEDLWLDADNLTNTADSDAPLPATITARSNILRTGTLFADVALVPSAQTANFDAKLRLTGLPLEYADTLIAYYAPFDIEGGQLDLVAEISAERDSLDGYLKPLIHDLEVFEWRKDVIEDNDNPFRIVWESMVNLVGELLENQSKNQLATIIPVSGSLNQPDLGLASSLSNILRNAFVEAYEADFEQTLPVGEEVEEVAPDGE